MATNYPDRIRPFSEDFEAAAETGVDSRLLALADGGLPTRDRGHVIVASRSPPLRASI